MWIKAFILITSSFYIFSNFHFQTVIGLNTPFLKVAFHSTLIRFFFGIQPKVHFWLVINPSQTVFLCLTHTVRRFHSETISILWSEIRVLWPPKISLKFKPYLWASSSKQICARSFKWGTKSFWMSIGFEVIDLQSQQSKKILDLLSLRLYFLRVYIVNRCSLGGMGSITGHCKIWELITLNFFDLYWQMIPLLKDLNNIC